MPREPQLREIELQLRQAIRDAVNRTNRKPFYWGGMVGYEQLAAIAQALHTVEFKGADAKYLEDLLFWVDRALNNHRASYEDIQAAHDWLRQVADCLRYPIHSPRQGDKPTIALDDLTSQQIQQEMDELLQQFQPAPQDHPVQAALAQKLQRSWSDYGSPLLYCYDIPGLPPDNMRLEALFGQLRRHTRRISGRKSTVELQVFGQYQVLFSAASEADLLAQLRHVPVSEYQTQRQRLAQAEEPKRFKRRLHKNPAQTIQQLVEKLSEQLQEQPLPNSLSSAQEATVDAVALVCPSPGLGEVLDALTHQAHPVRTTSPSHKPRRTPIDRTRKHSSTRMKPTPINTKPVRMNQSVTNPFYYKRYFLNR